MNRKGLVIALSVLALLALPFTASATNAWSKYHWERTTDAPLALSFGDNTGGPSEPSTRWSGHLTSANADWNDAGKWGRTSVLSNTVVDGRATSTSTCTPAAGNVEVCAQDYGENGWLGVAGIWVTRGKDKHITRGYVKLNDWYFDRSYATADWRQLVTCQEAGHIFGLSHQDESCTNANLGTCMDYTSDPAGNTQPNAHDYDQLLAIYDGHHFSDGGGDDGGGGNGGGPPPGRGRGNGNGNGNGTGADHNEFGRAIHADPDGRPDVFELDLPNGEKLITHVTWAR